MAEGEKKTVWEIATRTPHTFIPDISKMPLPAQIIFRAAQHFASKAADGADITLTYDFDTDKPYLKCETKKSWFDMEYLGDVLLIKFTRMRKVGDLKVKQIAIRCSLDTAKNIVAGTADIFIDAISDLYVHSNPNLDAIFDLPPPP
jgi:uncharacterized protein YuzE